ncbi:MAG: SigE family RNA polymerase sigma factor [Propionicimonas sp.]
MGKGGPTAGFTEFVASASGYLTRTAFLLTGDEEAARDLVQEALTRTYASWWRVRKPDALRYARRVLLNLHIDQYRRRTPEPVAWSDLPDREDQYDRADARDEASRLLASLTPQQRRIIVLRYFADLPEAEVAACLGISVGAVKSACSRGLAALRRSIGKTEEEPS